MMTVVGIDLLGRKHYIVIRSTTELTHLNERYERVIIL